MSITIDVDIKEIYRLLCSKCKKKVKALVMQKVSEKLAEQVLAEK